MDDDILPITEDSAPATLGQEANAARGYAAASRAVSTRLIYDADWQRFQTWCATRGGAAAPSRSGDGIAVLRRRGRGRTRAVHYHPPAGRHRLGAQARRSSSRRSTPTAPGRSPRSWPVSGGRALRRRRKRPRPMPMCCATCCAPAPVMGELPVHLPAVLYVPLDCPPDRLQVGTGCGYFRIGVEVAR